MQGMTQVSKLELGFCRHYNEDAVGDSSPAAFTARQLEETLRPLKQVCTGCASP